MNARTMVPAAAPTNTHAGADQRPRHAGADDGSHAGGDVFYGRRLPFHDLREIATARTPQGLVDTAVTLYEAGAAVGLVCNCGAASGAAYERLPLTGISRRSTCRLRRRADADAILRSFVGLREDLYRGPIGVTVAWDSGDLQHDSCPSDWTEWASGYGYQPASATVTRRSRCIPATSTSSSYSPAPRTRSRSPRRCPNGTADNESFGVSEVKIEVQVVARYVSRRRRSTRPPRPQRRAS